MFKNLLRKALVWLINLEIKAYYNRLEEWETQEYYQYKELLKKRIELLEAIHEYEEKKKLYS